MARSGKMFGRDRNYNEEDSMEGPPTIWRKGRAARCLGSFGEDAHASCLVVLTRCGTDITQPQHLQSRCRMLQRGLAWCSVFLAGTNVMHLHVERQTARETGKHIRHSVPLTANIIQKVNYIAICYIKTTFCTTLTLS